MSRAGAATPDDYVAGLEPDRAAAIARVRDLVNRALPDGYRETVAFGMISWSVPLELYPDTYNRQPLVYAALAAQKKYNSLYLNAVYSSPERAERFRAAFEAAGKRLDMGKSCIRFNSADDLPAQVIADEIASMPPADYIALYEQSRSRRSC